MAGFTVKGYPRPLPSYAMSGSNLLTITPNAGLLYSSGQVEPLGDPPRLSDFNSYIDTYGPNKASLMGEGNWYMYDGDRTFRFLAEWTGDTSTYMPTSVSIRDAYWEYSTMGSNNRPDDYRMYTDGLYLSALDTGFPQGVYQTGFSSVAEAFAHWSDSFGYSHIDTATSHWGHTASRPMSYTLMCCVRGEQLEGAAGFDALLNSSNGSLDYRYGVMLDKMENHLYQWRNNDFTDPSDTPFMTPFMVGLTVYALAEYYDQRGNQHWKTGNWPTIPDAIQDMLVWLYNDAPNHDVGGRLLMPDYDGPGSYDAFPYADRTYTSSGGSGDGFGSSADLNNIIAPCYAWLGKHTGDSVYITDMADRLFAGHIHEFVNDTWYGNSPDSTKQWNEWLYRVQDYFDWRDAFGS